MIRRLLVVLLGAAMLLAGCAGGRQGEGGADATQLRRQMMRKADDSVAGTLVVIDGERLRVAPFQGGAPITHVIGEELPVFLGGEPVERSALRPGAEVNVFFVREGGETRAVGVQLLEPGFARALKQQF